MDQESRQPALAIAIALIAAVRNRSVAVGRATSFGACAAEEAAPAAAELASETAQDGEEAKADAKLASCANKLWMAQQARVDIGFSRLVEVAAVLRG